MTGVGGSGKTDGIARRARAPGGISGRVFFINLAPLREPALLVSSIAKIFSLHALPPVRSWMYFGEFLMNKENAAHFR